MRSSLLVVFIGEGQLWIILWIQAIQVNSKIRCRYSMSHIYQILDTFSTHIRWSAECPRHHGRYEDKYLGSIKSINVTVEFWMNIAWQCVITSSLNISIQRLTTHGYDYLDERLAWFQSSNYSYNDFTKVKVSQWQKRIENWLPEPELFKKGAVTVTLYWFNRDCALGTNSPRPAVVLLIGMCSCVPTQSPTQSSGSTYGKL